MVVATLGTTLAPWGLAFIQSYAVDKRLKIKDLGYERVDVVSGALLTGVIGVFIVVACAATLHANGQHIHEASDAAIALRPLAGSSRADPIRAWACRGRPARGRDRATLNRLFGRGVLWATLRSQ